MISVEKALELIAEYTPERQTIELDLLDAMGMVVAEDIFSPINLPPFRQSAMDGYALRWKQEENYRLIGEVKAGDNSGFKLEEEDAVRIFTGAMVPENADTVVIQEHVEKASDKIRIAKLPAKGANIRNEGEQLLQREKVLGKGQPINEATLGLLAGLGLERVRVYKTPSIGILVTGNELQKPGTSLTPGKIYESNSVMLKGALKRNNFNELNTYMVRDDAANTIQLIQKALEENEVLLISGGISVGKYDFVREALIANEVEEIFYKINQKPGKPLWFGIKGSKRIFALPGNPASSLVCFHVYVLPELKRQKGCSRSTLKTFTGKINASVKNPSGKSLFLKAKAVNGKVSILDGQSSAMLHSFSQSNALTYIPEDVSSVEKNENIKYLDLGYE